MDEVSLSQPQPGDVVMVPGGRTGVVEVAEQGWALIQLDECFSLAKGTTPATEIIIELRRIKPLPTFTG